MTDESASAYRSGLRYLGPRPRSVAELRENLLKKNFTKDTVEKTVALLKEENLLDDPAFAAEFVRSRERLNPKSKRALKYELFAKGVEESVIEKAVEPLNEYESALKAAEKKAALWEHLDREKFKKKVFNFLNARGFGFDVTMTTYKHLLQKAEKKEGPE
ncbi:MAG: recombination regulator RecX [Desulfarculaceae bacterium]|nr:recombination regulator RecX [Desulfarculaceae bacterium]